MSAHNRVGRFYVKVGRKYFPARIGIGATDPTVAVRSLLSDDVVGDLDSIIITASLAGHVKDHGNVRIVTDATLGKYGDWRADDVWTVRDFVLSHSNTKTQRESLCKDLGIFVG